MTEVAVVLGSTGASSECRLIGCFSRREVSGHGHAGGGSRIEVRGEANRDAGRRIEARLASMKRTAIVKDALNKSEGSMGQE
jgi:hypothetical protein